jgi:hypothetical protein
MDVKNCVELLERQAVLNLRGVVPIYSISQSSLAHPHLRVTLPVNRRTCFTEYPGTGYFRPIPEPETAFKTR